LPLFFWSSKKTTLERTMTNIGAVVHAIVSEIRHKPERVKKSVVP
jgi:hypothetical protein